MERASPRQLLRLFQGSRARKVFAVGFNKTGTSSIHRLFGELGYRSYHGTKWRDTSRPALYYIYDAFSDGVPTDVRRLDQLFPNARFILQVRDLDTWIDSRLEHIRRRPTTNRRHDPDWTATPAAVSTWVAKRDAHHVDVLRLFAGRPEKLLLVNFIRDPGAATRIASFLGHERPVEKPHANQRRSSGRRLRNEAMIEATLTDLALPRVDWQYDICTSAAAEQFGVAPDTAFRDDA